MIEPERHLLEEHPEWREVLRAYDAKLEAEKKLNPDHDGWLPRLKNVVGIDSGELPAIHGQLIAHGLVKFQIGDRTTGVQYQLSRSGRSIVRGSSESSDVESQSPVADAA